MLRILVVATMLFGAVPAAQAIITWEASGGWNFGGTNSFGGLTQPSNPPALVTSGGDFSNGGALCPALGTPNYICASYFGKAELVGSPGGVVRMHAAARVRQKDAVSTGAGKIVYGGARVWFIGAGYASAVPSPVAQAVFNFGLHGTRSESSNNGNVTVVAKGTAFLVADKQRFVQCFADVCEPIKVPISSAWDPGAPNGTSFYIDLRADASIGAPAGTAFDAEAIADYKDTLELISVELQDENGVAVPDAQLVVRDNDQNVVYTIANTPTTTTTTLSGQTTTTTLPGETTTTTVAGSTTTTTLIGVCPAATTYSAIACRLATLLNTVVRTADGPIGVKLTTKVSTAQQAVVDAEALVVTSRKQSSKRLVKALKALGAFQKVLKTRGAKNALGEHAAILAASAGALRAEVKVLRAGGS